jgi:hypothetical protein
LRLPYHRTFIKHCPSQLFSGQLLALVLSASGILLQDMLQRAGATIAVCENP